MLQLLLRARMHFPASMILAGWSPVKKSNKYSGISKNPALIYLFKCHLADCFSFILFIILQFKNNFMKRNMLIMLLFSAYNLSAQKAEVFSKEGTAIRGYDAVAYFNEAKPVKGNDAFNFIWNDTKWIFSTQQNLDSFKSDPVKFAPQYGGYCAYGVSEDHKSPTDPLAWTIINGKLYLNYNLKVKELWSRDQQKRIEDADKNWLLLRNRE